MTLEFVRRNKKMKKRSWMPNDQNIKIDTLARMILEEANI